MRDVATSETFREERTMKRRRPRAFWMQGLRHARRYAIEFEGVSNKKDRTGEATSFFRDYRLPFAPTRRPDVPPNSLQHFKGALTLVLWRRRQFLFRPMSCCETRLSDNAGQLAPRPEHRGGLARPTRGAPEWGRKQPVGRTGGATALAVARGRRGPSRRRPGIEAWRGAAVLKMRNSGKRS